MGSLPSNSVENIDDHNAVFTILGKLARRLNGTRHIASGDRDITSRTISKRGSAPKKDGSYVGIAVCPVNPEAIGVRPANTGLVCIPIDRVNTEIVS